MGIFRFPDRDMVMRFYWGSAVGHTYAHAQSSRETREDDSSNVSEAVNCVVPDDVSENDREIDAGEPELEFTLDVHDGDDWDDVVDGMVDGDDLHDSMADELFAPMCDT